MDPTCFNHLLQAIHVEVEKRKSGEVPGTMRQAELYNERAGVNTVQFVLDSKYLNRAAGVNPTEAKWARLMPPTERKD